MLTNHPRAVPRGFRHEGSSYKIPIPFLRFLVTMTGTGPAALATSVRFISHLLPVPRPDHLVRSCFVVHAHGLLGREIDFVPCSSRVARPRSASHGTGLRNSITICVLRV